MKFPPVNRVLFRIMPLLGILLWAPLPSTVCADEILTLTACIESARKHNPTLKTASWDIASTSETIALKQAASYPRIDANLGYSMQLEPQAVIIAGRVAETQEPSYLFGGLSAYYTLYDFGRRASSLEQARLANKAASHGFKAQSAQSVLQVIETYFSVLELQKVGEAVAQEVSQLEQHRAIAQALYDEGVVTRNDILQADVRLASVRQKLLALHNRRENVWLQLNYLTGKPADYRAALDDKTVIPLQENSTVQENTVMAGRGEIMVLRSLSEIADSVVSESRSNFFPEFYSRLALDYVQNDKVREQAIMSATIGIKVNIFDGFASSASRNKAVSERSKSRDALAQAESQIRLEIETARNDRSVAVQRIAVAETSIKQSKENLRINQERYKERVGTATEVIDAQTMVTQTQSEYYRALFDLQIANARYQKAIGNLI